MANTYRMGTCFLFAGDFQDSSGAFNDVQHLGYTRGDVIVRLNPALSRGKADQLGAAAMADAVWLGGYAPEIQAPLIDEDHTKMQDIFPGSTLVTGSGSRKAIKFPSAPQQILNSELNTLALIPQKETYTSHGSGESPWDDPDAWYFSAVLPLQPGEFIYGPVEDDEDGLNAHTVTFAALYRKNWADNSTAVASGCEVFWRGSPRAAGITEAVMPFMGEGLSTFNTLKAS